jgi:hypothetical protein
MHKDPYIITNTAKVYTNNLDVYSREHGFKISPSERVKPGDKVLVVVRGKIFDCTIGSYCLGLSDDYNYFSELRAFVSKC